MSTLTAPAPAATGTDTDNKRRIKKVAVLGAGIMGSRIAMHFANIGVEALLLDIVPRELNEKEKAKGLTLESPQVRNRLVNELFESAFKGKPSPIYDKSFKQRITLGNMTDDMAKIADVDWIVEVVVERLDIKKQVFENVEKHRKPGTLVTSNTSGIPIAHMAEGRSEDFQHHFCGTHFFNPPRYLPLLEIIPTEHTKPEVVNFLMDYGARFLGKKTVLAKDTPAFIANRVGIFTIMQVFELMQKHGMTVEEIDAFTGKLIGHPKTGTFRLSDLIGLDTTVHVAKGIADNCPDDERHEIFAIPEFVNKMVEKNLLGDKTQAGFYKKERDANGKKNILALDLTTLEYRPKEKPESETLKAAKKKDHHHDSMKVLMAADDKFGQFFREFSYGLFAYVSHRVPEIADEVYQIDDAMRAGFAWQEGPFEKWDIAGFRETFENAKAAGYAFAPWVQAMYDAGHTSFYTLNDGVKSYYSPSQNAYHEIPGQGAFIVLKNLPAASKVWSNKGASIYDLGDGILNVEFHTKMNSVDEDVIRGIHEAIDLAEAKYDGLIIGNQGENFSAGANIFMIMMLASQKQWDQLDFAVKAFQDTSMRLRYSSIPVCVAPHTLTLGGGCEFTMHADFAQAAAETYIGLVEVGVGLIPGGGGTKEFTKRLGDRHKSGDVDGNVFQEYLMTIAQAKVATSAVEAFGLDILQHGKDHISINKERQLADAKQRLVVMADQGYTPPISTPVYVLGHGAYGGVEAAVEQLIFGKYASAHDGLIASKIGYVMCGGSLTGTQHVSEQYLLDLEREAFCSLAGEQKTIERIGHMLQTGKPLRN